jgi:predicted acyltransferase
MLLFAGFYWLIDVKGWKGWAFWLTVIGLNPLTIYVVQELFDFSHVSEIFAGGLANHAGIYKVLVMAVATMATKWLFLYFLYRKKIFLKA